MNIYFRKFQNSDSYTETGIFVLLGGILNLLNIQITDTCFPSSYFFHNIYTCTLMCCCLLILSCVRIQLPDDVPKRIVMFTRISKYFVYLIISEFFLKIITIPAFLLAQFLLVNLSFGVVLSFIKRYFLFRWIYYLINFVIEFIVNSFVLLLTYQFIGLSRVLESNFITYVKCKAILSRQPLYSLWCGILDFLGLDLYEQPPNLTHIDPVNKYKILKAFRIQKRRLQYKRRHL